MKEAQNQQRYWISSAIYPVYSLWNSTFSSLIRPHSQQFLKQFLAVKQKSDPVIKEQQIFLGVKWSILISSKKLSTEAEK